MVTVTIVIKEIVGKDMLSTEVTLDPAEDSTQKEFIVGDIVDKSVNQLFRSLFEPVEKDNPILSQVQGNETIN